MNATRSATRILLRRRGLEPKLKFFAQKLSNLGSVSNKLMQLMRSIEWAKGGQSLQPLGDFCD